MAVLPDPVRPELTAALQSGGTRPCLVREAEALIWTGDRPEELDLVWSRADRPRQSGEQLLGKVR
jgi:hypothetical protein